MPSPSRPQSRTRPQFRIQEVAQRAGVSASTVSRVLNGTATVRAAKREQVLAVIEELGYRPNRVASNLRRQQAQMIGVVVPDIENPHFTQMVRAVEDTAYLSGYRVLLCNTDEDPAKQREYLGVLAAERVTGAIIAPTDAGAPEVSELLDYGISVVTFDRTVTDRRADAVLASNVDGVRLGTEHLIEGGHTRIGLISGPLTLSTGSERLLGYEQAVTAAGLPTLVAQGHFRVEGGRQAAAELLAAEATALLVANNLMAVGALQALKDANLKVPTDVALLSVDDPPWASLTDPPLTTLAQPVRAMASAAVELLLPRLQGGQQQGGQQQGGQQQGGRQQGGRQRRRRRVFDFELRHRSSCCPAGY
jgi:LacI family transcriptional regulator